MNGVPYDLGRCEIEFTQDVEFEALGPVKSGRFSAPKGRRIRVEVVEDRGGQVIVQFPSASCATLDKAWFRRLKRGNHETHDPDFTMAEEVRHGKRICGREKQIIETALQGLFEYYPCLSDGTLVEEIEAAVTVPDTGNGQEDYESVRNQVEHLARQAEPRYDGSEVEPRGGFPSQEPPSAPGDHTSATSSAPRPLLP